MVVRPGCEVQMWYGFDYYGTNKTYQTGIYTNVGPVEDPNCNVMYGYADNLCPPVSAKFSCSMTPLDCSPREEFLKVHSCDFGSSELCQFSTTVGTEYEEDIAKYMQMNAELAEEYVKEMGDIFTDPGWDNPTHIDWTAGLV